MRIASPLTLAIVAAPVLHAQDSFRLPAELGASVAVAHGMSAGFADHSCGDPDAVASALGGRLSVRPARRVAVGATLDGFSTRPVPVCAAVPAPPIENGTRIDTAFADGMRGYPLAHASVRAAFAPVMAARAELRVHGGVGRFLGRNITTTHLGVAALLGAGRVRWFAEGDLTSYQTHEVENSATFQDFKLVSYGSTEFRRWKVTSVFRVGLAIRVGPDVRRIAGGSPATGAPQTQAASVSGRRASPTPSRAVSLPAARMPDWWR